MKSPILILALLTSSLAMAEDLAKTPPPPARMTQGSPGACCCKEETNGAYTRGSVYQLEAQFIDDSGKSFSLGSLRGRPVVIDMFYASCGNACPLTVTDMLGVQHRLVAKGCRQTVFVLVSFDGDRDSPEALARYRALRHLDGQWVLLKGKPDSVRELAAVLGVKYKQAADGSYSHSNLLTVLNADGEIVHQRVGLQGGLDETVGSLLACAK